MRKKPSPETRALVARLEAEFWKVAVPRLCKYISASRPRSLNSPQFLRAARQIADETAREVFSAAMRRR